MTKGKGLTKKQRWRLRVAKVCIGIIWSRKRKVSNFILTSANKNPAENRDSDSQISHLETSIQTQNRVNSIESEDKTINGIVLKKLFFNEIKQISEAINHHSRLRTWSDSTETSKYWPERKREREIYRVLANWISASRALSESLKDFRIFLHFPRRRSKHINLDSRVWENKTYSLKP